MSEGTSPPDLPERKSQGRNILVILLAASAFVFLICIGCAGGIFFFVTGALKSSDIYTEALSAAQKNSEV